MKIRFERTTTITEVGFLDIPDDTPELDAYLKTAARGVEGFRLNPLPTEWKQIDRRIRIKGEPLK